MMAYLRILAVALAVALISPGLSAQEASDSDATPSRGVTSGEYESVDAHPAGHGGSAAAAAHGHEGPNPNNVNSAGGLESLLELQTSKALWTLVVFLLTLAGLWAFAWKPITDALDKRERVIANNLADAKNASEQAMAKLKEYEAKLATAAGEATDMVVAARKDAEAASARIIADAQDEAARQRERAVAEIEAAKQNALSEMAAKSTDLAFSVARRVIGRELGPQDHQQLINEAMNSLPSRN